MWARIVECMLGCWLLISPFVFAHSEEHWALWTNDLAAGGMLITFSLASYWRPTGWAHWLFVPLAVWLVVFGRFSSSPPLEPALQNEIIIGLLLLMFAIVPNEASQPPRAWRRSANSYPPPDSSGAEHATELAATP